MEKLPKTIKATSSEVNSWLGNNGPSSVDDKGAERNEPQNVEPVPVQRHTSAERGEKVLATIENQDSIPPNDLPLYRWDNFKQLGDDARLNYLNTLRDRYHAKLPTIDARVLWASEKTLRKEAQRLGYEPWHQDKSSSSQDDDERAQRFVRWRDHKQNEQILEKATVDDPSRGYAFTVECSSANAERIEEYIHLINSTSKSISYIASKTNLTPEKSEERQIEDSADDTENYENLRKDDLPQYSWEQFKSMANEEKLNYLNNFRDRYNTTLGEMAYYVLNSTPTKLRAEARKIGYSLGDEFRIAFDKTNPNKKEKTEEEKEFADWLKRRNKERLNTVGKDGKTLQQKIDDLPLYRWKEFTHLSDDEKLKYLDNLRDLFDFGAHNIAIHVLHSTEAEVRAEAKKVGHISPKTPNQRYSSEQKYEDYRKWIEKREKEEKSVVDPNRTSTLTINCSAPNALKIVQLINTVTGDSGDIQYSVYEDIESNLNR